MKIIGYRVGKKFDLALDESYEAETISQFIARILDGFSGLVLFHGKPEDHESSQAPGSQQKGSLQDIFLEAARRRRCAILVFSTDVIPRPAAATPLIHFHSVGIESVKPNRFQPLFQELVSAFRKFQAMPDDQTVEQLWDIVDPYARPLQQVRLLERYQNEQPSRGPKTVSAKWKQIFEPLYGPDITHEKLMQIYRDLVSGNALKKKLNQWQTQRESVSHQLFHHSFYALISRPALCRALETGGESPAGVLPALRKWTEVKTEITALLDSAVPNAIAAGDLNVALLQPGRPESKEIIERYSRRYGNTIKDHLTPVYNTVHAIDREVEKLLAAVTREGPCVLPRSNIVDLCRGLANQLAELKELESLGESDG